MSQFSYLPLGKITGHLINMLVKDYVYLHFMNSFDLNIFIYLHELHLILNAMVLSVIQIYSHPYTHIHGVRGKV